MVGFLILCSTSELNIIRKAFGQIGLFYGLSKKFGGVVSLLLFRGDIVLREDVYALLRSLSFLKILGISDGGLLHAPKTYWSMYTLRGFSSVLFSFKSVLCVIYSRWVLNYKQNGYN